MPDLQYYIRHDAGLWHWDVRTEYGEHLGHGATLTRATATAEAMFYAAHPARSVEVDAIELAKSAERLEIAYCAYAAAEQSSQVAEQQLIELAWLRNRNQALTS